MSENSSKKKCCRKVTKIAGYLLLALAIFLVLRYGIPTPKIPDLKGLNLNFSEPSPDTRHPKDTGNPVFGNHQLQSDLDAMQKIWDGITSRSSSEELDGIKAPSEYATSDLPSPDPSQGPSQSPSPGPAGPDQSTTSGLASPGEPNMQ